MSNEARVRIDSHRLMREEKKSLHEERINLAHESLRGHKKIAANRWKWKVLWHILIFTLSFIFTSGFALLCILLWVKPDSFTALVFSGILSGFVFIVCFAYLRILVLYHFLNEYPNKEEDPGFTYHISKSVSYAIVALILAVICAGIFAQLASAGIV